MKTLNLNKILLLISLFLISAVFSTAADASCRYTDAGLLDVAVDGSGNSDALFMKLLEVREVTSVKIRQMNTR